MDLGGYPKFRQQHLKTVVEQDFKQHIKMETHLAIQNPRFVVNRPMLKLGKLGQAVSAPNYCWQMHPDSARPDVVCAGLSSWAQWDQSWTDWVIFLG